MTDDFKQVIVLEFLLDMQQPRQEAMQPQETGGGRELVVNSPPPNE
jgi:hypothetical protein